MKFKIEKNKNKPYKFAFQSNKEVIKLNANENQYPISIGFIKNIIKEIKYFGNILKFYPDSNSNEIINKISKYYNIKKEYIFLGNSSDEVLAHIFITFLKKKVLYISDITYCFYESYIKLYKINYNIIKLNKNKTINLKPIKDNKYNVILTNPNALIGKYIGYLELKLLISKNLLSKIIIDEAYIDFNNNSEINLIKNYKNIIIVQTLSKSRCLAGIRFGFALSFKENIESLNKTKNSFNTYPINKISQIIVKNVLENNNNFKKIIKKITKNKYFLIKNLKKLNFKIIKSKSNFLLITNKKINMNFLEKKLKKNKILIRKFEIPKIENYLRISIGSLKNCKKLIKIIKYILNKINKKKI